MSGEGVFSPITFNFGIEIKKIEFGISYKWPYINLSIGNRIRLQIMNTVGLKRFYTTKDDSVDGEETPDEEEEVEEEDENLTLDDVIR